MLSKAEDWKSEARPKAYVYSLQATNAQGGTARGYHLRYPKKEPLTQASLQSFTERVFVYFIGSAAEEANVYDWKEGTENKPLTQLRGNRAIERGDGGRMATVARAFSAREGISVKES